MRAYILAFSYLVFWPSSFLILPNVFGPPIMAAAVFDFYDRVTVPQTLCMNAANSTKDRKKKQAQIDLYGSAR